MERVKQRIELRLEGYPLSLGNARASLRDDEGVDVAVEAKTNVCTFFFFSAIFARKTRV